MSIQAQGNRMDGIREAPFALRVVQRNEGKAAIVYRRAADAKGRDRLQRVGAISPLAYTAAGGLLRDAVGEELSTGPFHVLPLDQGVRVVCYALVASRLRNGERLRTAALHLRHADADEAAWWLGLMQRDDEQRALRALRILTEAVE